MKQIKSILLGISLFLLHSCNLLDVDTVSSITGDGYWNTKGDVESYLIGIYTKLRDTSNSTLHLKIEEMLYNRSGRWSIEFVGAESDFTKRIWLVKLLFGNSAL